MIDPTAIPLEVDPREQRFVGIAYHGDTPFDVPFVSEIADNLWMGGCANGLVMPPNIEHVVALYVAERYEVRHQLRSMLSIVMYDSEEQATDLVVDLARWINGCRENGPTLVHCQAGLNRSGMVVATALVLGGMEPADAIALLREKRSDAVLCNKAFERWVLDDTTAHRMTSSLPGIED